MDDNNLVGWYLLTSCAVGVAKVMLACANELRSRVAGDIGTRLHLISFYLKSLPVYLIDQDVEQLWQELLKELLRICTWPPPLDASAGMLLHDVHASLSRLLQQENQRSLKGSIAWFLRKEKVKAEAFKLQCHGLYTKLHGGDPDSPEGLPEGVQHLDQNDYPDHVNRNLFEALQLHSACHSSLHGAAGEGQSIWHPTRLHLHSDLQTQDKMASFDILVSSMDMTFWQEFCLRIPLQSSGPRGHARFADDPNSAPQISHLLRQGSFCGILERRIFARIGLEFERERGLYQLHDAQTLEQGSLPGRGIALSSVLQHYRLTVKDKISLAHAIARAYWQFYDSELMRTKWTSETIWFMPEDNDGESRDQLPLKAYIAFQFGTSRGPLKEYLDADLLVHRYPRILALGILLLEIGLGRPFPPRNYPDFISQMNLDHRIAMRRLHELENTKWEKFSHKGTFVEAVENCLNYENFRTPPNPQKKAHESPAKQDSRTRCSDESFEVSERRKRLYKKVVRPLAWLTERGFRNNSENITYITRSEENASPDDEPGSGFWQQDQAAMFHSGKDIKPQEWLDNLKEINAHVQRQLRKAKNTTPIRVAILDTGYNPEVPFFQDTRRSDRIKGWRDFVCGLQTPIDSYGHGTFMTRLVIESAPCAEVYVARVAENTDQLVHSQDKVVEAIRWAGLTWKASIISMSFGFAQDSESISQAILSVQMDRSEAVIFLASAGNSSYEDETFPARHQSVISIYATDCRGTFAASNPRNDRDGPTIFGTFGDDIPEGIREELQKFYQQQVCEPGSSIATAVAAGIAATMLSYATVLPLLCQFGDTSGVLKRLWKFEGMDKMFYMMSQDMGERRRFVNPIRFWSERSTDLARYCAIHDCMWKVVRS